MRTARDDSWREAKSSSSASVCTTNSVAAIPSSGGATSRVVQLSGTLGGTPAIGTPVLIYESVQYRFAPSTLVPGQLGLWRTTALLDEEARAVFPHIVLGACKHVVGDA